MGEVLKDGNAGAMGIDVFEKFDKQATIVARGGVSFQEVFCLWHRRIDEGLKVWHSIASFNTEKALRMKMHLYEGDPGLQQHGTVEYLPL